MIFCEEGSCMRYSEDDFKMTAPCGLDCSICELHPAGKDDNLRAYLISRGIPEEKLPCPGCRELKGECPVLRGSCATYQCAKKHDVDFCFQCGDYPCGRLNPSLDMADTLPHNLKIYNLAYIEKHGLEDFRKHSVTAKKLYFQGRMHIGEGPLIEQKGE